VQKRIRNKKEKKQNKNEKKERPVFFYYSEGDISVVKERAFHLIFLLSCLPFVIKMHILSHKDDEIHHFYRIFALTLRKI